VKTLHTAIDLFSGAGGASFGLKKAGFKVLVAVDIDPSACKTYKKNLGLEPICGDLKVITGYDILEHCGLRSGDVSVVAGCPPCQGFSSLRRTRYPSGLDMRNNLIDVFLKRVEEIDPKGVIFENVSGITKLHGRKFFEKYLNMMEKMGYSTSWEVVNAADFGVPQYRKRVIALSLKDKKVPIYPHPTHARPKIATGELEPWVNVWETIRGLPPLEAGESDPKIPNHAARNHSRRIKEIISLIPKDGGSRRSLPREYWLPCHQKLHLGRGWGAENIYGRMCWSKPAPTLTCRCTTPSSGRFLHPVQDRAITPREAARFQRFPDCAVFPTFFSHAEKQIGNAIPVDLMGVMASSLSESL
jgi:DNA (cytosine-5)-methyltransferase 1